MIRHAIYFDLRFSASKFYSVLEFVQFGALDVNLDHHGLSPHYFFLVLE